MKKIITYWRYFTLLLMLVGVMSFGYARVSVIPPNTDLATPVLGSMEADNPIAIVYDGNTEVTISSLNLGDASAFAPTNVVAVDYELFVGDAVQLSWDAETGGTGVLQGYNVYRDGTKINTALVTITSYTDNVGLVYNMAPGYVYTVTSVVDNVESAPSAPSDPVFFSGNGTIEGTVTDVLTTEQLLGATITLEGTDEFGDEVGYNTTTNATGFYTLAVKAGTYEVTAAADGYNEAMSTGVTVTYNNTTTVDFALEEFPFPAESVTAIIENNNRVRIQWSQSTSRGFVNYTVYRQEVLQEPPFTAQTFQIGTTTAGVMFDDSWGNQEPGVYNWFVVANYTGGNDSEPAYSNNLNKEMKTQVDVTVTTEFGDSPTATVTFTNTSEPNLELVYTKTLPANGKATFANFQKGSYNITVALAGYNTLTTSAAIWDTTSFSWELQGGNPAPTNVVAANDSLYFGQNAVLSWDAPPTSELKAYKVYRNGVALFNNPITVTSYTDVAPPVDMTPSQYTVTAIYLSGGTTESAPSNQVPVYVTGKGFVSGTITNRITEDSIQGAQVKLSGIDQFGNPQNYTFITNNKGKYVDVNGVWAGTYTYTVSASTFADEVKSDVVIAYNATTTENFALYPGIQVTAVQQSSSTVLVDWAFDGGSEPSNVVEFRVYRALWNENNESNWTLLGVTQSTSFLDTEWGTITSGVYKWVVKTIYTGNLSSTNFSNFIEKNMETQVNVTVALNSGQSPAGATVKMTNKSEPYLNLVYNITINSTGTATIAPFRKGLYDIEVSNPGYTTIFETKNIQDLTNLSYLLIEELNTVKNLFVTPNGFATWQQASTTTANSRELGSFLGYKVFLGVVLSGTTQDTSYNFEAEETLVPNTVYTAKVEAEYTTGTATPQTYTFTYRACTYYKPVTNFTAERVIGTMNVAMSWVNNFDTINGDVFTGTNIYRNGELIAFVKRATTTDTSYVDNQVPSGTYNYCLRQVYASTGQSCQVCNQVNVTAGGFVNGFVTSFDPANVPIEGASVALVGESDSYIFTTNSTGYYQGEVVDGIYTYTVSAPEFQSQTLVDTVVFGETVSNNFALLDFPIGVDEVIATELSDNAVQVSWSEQGSNKSTSLGEFLGYNIYRGACGGDATDMTFLGFTVDLQFTDNTWGTAESGVYTWAVEVVYEDNTSANTYSNCIDKDMNTEVTVTVTTNTGDSPSGTIVMLTNTSEPDLEIIYTAVLDAAGFVEWTDFRKGTYDIMVSKSGFTNIEESGVEIIETTDFFYTLQESLLPPSDLYVTPTGLASWGIGDSEQYNDRAIEYYKVFLNNNFITDTDADFYQYGSNGEELESGIVYQAEVAAVYSTGISERSSYEWTYYPCDSFPGPEVFNAENVEGTNNVLLTWINTSSNRSTNDLVVGANLYRDGMMIAEAVTINTYLDENLEPGYYDYCITYLYESGAESCLNLCVNDVEVPEDCTAPMNLTATLDEETYSSIHLDWNSGAQTLVEITQNPGSPANGYFQTFDYGYGVIYDLTAYPDALANSIEFHHSSYGVFGTWDYNIYIIDWRTKTTIAVLGPFSTTGNDIWETVELGDIDLLGETSVAFLMEPLSNLPDNAYPSLSADNSANPQGSVYGPLDNNFSEIGSSGVGNFLMNIFVMTAYGEKVMLPTVISLPAPVQATPRIGTANLVTDATINQTAEIVNSSRTLEGYNIYRDGALLVSLWQETNYTDTDVIAGSNYCYEVSAVYAICGESDMSNEACAGFVGVPDGASSKVSIYPNPASDIVSIECQDMKNITVFNYVGQVVFSSELGLANKTQLNTSKYESGVYFVRIHTENGVVTNRVIISR